MSDQQTDNTAAAKKTVPPEHVVIDKPTTARDLFLMAVAGDPRNLAAAVACKPGETYTLQINIELHFTRDDTMAMLREGGYDVAFPGEAANDAEKPNV